MKLDTQTMIIFALLAILGVASYFRWFALPGKHQSYSPVKKGFALLGITFSGPACWILLKTATGYLPDGVTKWLLPIAPLIFLLFPSVRSARASEQEEQSQKRMTFAILFGGIVLIAICLTVFWSR